MFKLLKLACYAIVGYALYELYQGMMQRSAVADTSGDEGTRSFGEDEGHYGQITGPGRGMDDVTSDESGTEYHHRVGRGVVSR